MSEGRHPVTPTPMRAAIARRMVQSKSSAPHFYVSRDLEMDAPLAALEALNAGREKEERATVTALLIRALARSLGEHPAFNAVWDGDALVRVDAINIGVAIDLGDGLIAPALLGCERLSVDRIGADLRDLAARSRAGKLRAAEITEGTFTLTNLGMLGVTSFTAIITPPQVATLATGVTEERPVVRDGQVVAQRMMSATVSADHRAVDGAGAARLLATLQEQLVSAADWIAESPGDGEGRPAPASPKQG
jgi:pyruvate dehydrogenase E2 component (dihydrolipoamide acetyltransferase)